MRNMLVKLAVKLAKLSPEVLGRIVTLLSLLLLVGLAAVLVLFVQPLEVAIGLMIAFAVVYALRNALDSLKQMRVAQMQSMATLTTLLNKIAENTEKQGLGPLGPMKKPEDASDTEEESAND